MCPYARWMGWIRGQGQNDSSRRCYGAFWSPLVPICRYNFSKVSHSRTWWNSWKIENPSKSNKNSLIQLVTKNIVELILSQWVKWPGSYWIRPVPMQSECHSSESQKVFRSPFQPIWSWLVPICIDICSDHVVWARVRLRLEAGKLHSLLVSCICWIFLRNVCFIR